MLLMSPLVPLDSMRDERRRVTSVASGFSRSHCVIRACEDPEVIRRDVPFGTPPT